MPSVSCRCRFPSFLYRVYQPTLGRAEASPRACVALSAARAREGALSAPFREVTFCASYKCHCFGVKGSRLSWFRG